MVTQNSIINKILFTLAIFSVVIFATFPFIQMLSTSLKYQWDWGNPSLIPAKINLDAYSELLNINQATKNIPQSVLNLLEENSELTRSQKKSILDKYRSTGDVFPFFKYFRNSLVFSFSSAFISVIIAIFGAYSFSRVKYRGR